MKPAEPQAVPIPERKGVTVRVCTVEDATKGLREIHEYLQTHFHDQWDWMNAEFYLQVLEAQLRDAERKGWNDCAEAFKLAAAKAFEHHVLNGTPTQSDQRSDPFARMLGEDSKP